MPHATLQRLTRNRARLIERVTALSESELDQPHGDGWTVRQILTHLLNSEEDHCRVAAVIAKGELDRLPTEFDRDTHNEARVTERGYLATPDLFATLTAQRERTEALFNQFTEEQRDLSGPHPVLGDLTVDAIFRVIALHDSIHLRDINAALTASDRASDD